MEKREVIELFIIVYLIFFAALSLLQNNFEFFYYCFIFLSIITVMKAYDYKYNTLRQNIPTGILVGLAILGLAHFLGGALSINGVRLYDLHFILGYDNYVHTFGTFLITFLVFNYFSLHLSDQFKESPLRLAFLLVIFTLGIGSIVEIVEFLGVVFLHAQGVGDYANNATDQLFNMCGSIIATLLIYLKNYREK